MVAIRKALRHDGVNLNQREIQAALLFEKFRHVPFDRHNTLEQMVHFPAMLFQALEVRLVLGVQELSTPAGGHRDMGE